jgi:hypothetical protein
LTTDIIGSVDDIVFDGLCGERLYRRLLALAGKLTNTHLSAASLHHRCFTHPSPRSPPPCLYHRLIHSCPLSFFCLFLCRCLTAMMTPSPPSRVSTPPPPVQVNQRGASSLPTAQSLTSIHSCCFALCLLALLLTAAVAVAYSVRPFCFVCTTSP